MKMCDQSFEYVLQTWVWTLAVDEDCVVGNVVDCKILQRRHIHFGRVHIAEREYENALRDNMRTDRTARAKEIFGRSCSVNT